MFKKILGLATIAAAMQTYALSAAADTFVFTAIPDQDETQLIERFGAVEAYLEEQLDVDVKYIPVKSYAAAVSAFRNNQVQLAWFGGLSGVQARRLVPGSEAIAQGVEDPEFQSYVIANTSTGLEPMDELSEDLEGMTFTFGSKGSTSGRLMPEFFLREAYGEAPDEFFSRVGFSGNHTRTVRLVEAGTYQLGAVNYKVWESGVEDGSIDTDKVQVIWKTPYYPDYQWTIRGDVDERFGEGFKDRVTQALLDMDDPELLKRFPRAGFIPASNEDYAPIEETAEELGLLN
ncbi:putative selenate ABC transporter substrate-binding protein [Marinobacter segnicrescens]|uniref:Phosphonate transport system substrate-binding protein n=1 Tax=Marinobacter segnicrescens TaxID=430453 RepID=A0A1I0D7A9_9GAMM|nr:putative selenate ABC transporter substrate-binding protein [Marinobacter segnicrescens]SET27517.1 phosphonate transport system substrate-binding protein [Marinobacter segnicrescens]